MVEAILLQVLPPVREAIWVRMAYHRNHIMYVEHVLLHSLVLPLLDLIQCPYHGIIVTLVTTRLLHVHQQVPHGDILVLIQRVGPFAGVPMETGIDVGAHAGLIILLRKASTSKCQSMYITSAPGSVDLKISISNLVCASHFLSLLPLWPLCLCRWPTVSLTVEYPSESSAPLSGEEGGEPPPPTVVHWDFGGLLCSRTAPVQVVSLASVTSSTPEALPTCCGALPTSWLEESDPPVTTTGILWTGFSVQPLSLRRLEAATDHCHTSIRGKRLMVK